MVLTANVAKPGAKVGDLLLTVNDLAIIKDQLLGDFTDTKLAGNGSTIITNLNDLISSFIIKQQ